jgi:hypothetical protein
MLADERSFIAKAKLRKPYSLMSPRTLLQWKGSDHINIPSEWEQNFTKAHPLQIKTTSIGLEVAANENFDSLKTLQPTEYSVLYNSQVLGLTTEHVAPFPAYGTAHGCLI